MLQKGNIYKITYKIYNLIFFQLFSFFFNYSGVSPNCVLQNL